MTPIIASASALGWFVFAGLLVAALVLIIKAIRNPFGPQSPFEKRWDYTLDEITVNGAALRLGYEGDYRKIIADARSQRLICPSHSEMIDAFIQHSVTRGVRLVSFSGETAYIINTMGKKPLFSVIASRDVGLSDPRLRIALIDMRTLPAEAHREKIASPVSA